MNTVMVVFSCKSAGRHHRGVPEFLAWGAAAGALGFMMAQERESLMEGRWWLAVFRASASRLVLSANMGDWLQVRLDPQLRNR
jgi:ABC-type dipeptide/oligopeptide/nickel transport system permease subunit